MSEEARLLLETLSDLRVVDLKRELEKRKLSKSGSKKELCERLRNHLKIEELRHKNAEQGSDSITSLNLPSADAGMETNEFVKSYLEQREKLLERQMEQKKKYQEEAYKSQESESQSEAEDLSQHHQHNVAHEPENPEEICQQDEDLKPAETTDANVEKEHQSSRVAPKDRPEYNSETDEDTEDEGGNYESGSGRPNAAEGDKEGESTDTVEKCIEEVSIANDGDSSSAPCNDAGEKADISEVKLGQDDEVSEKVAENVSTSVGSSDAGMCDATSLNDTNIGETEPIVNEPSKVGIKMPDEMDLSEAYEMQGVAAADSTLTNNRSGVDNANCPKNEITESMNNANDESFQESTEVEAEEAEEVAAKEVREEEEATTTITPDSSCAEEPSESGAQSEIRIDEEVSEEKVEESNPRPTLISEEPLEVMVQKEDEFDDIKPADDNVDDKSYPVTSTSCHVEQEDMSNKKTDHDIQIFSRRLLRNSQKTEEAKEGDNQEKPARKRKWGSVELESQSVAISSDSLKGIIPEVMIDLSVPCDAMMDVIGVEDTEVDKKSKIFKRLITEPNDQQSEDGKRRKAVVSSSNTSTGSSATTVKLGRTIYQEVSDAPKIADDSPLPLKDMEKHRERRVIERKMSVEGELPERNVVIQSKDTIEDPSHVDNESASKRRRINPPLPAVDEPVTVERGRREMTPPRNPVSKFIHIFNLVRPYTLHQLKEILQRTGTLVESGFWIDKIKSHCIAEYETTEQAVASREALHGKKWPACNPKILRVDFSDENELEMMRNAKEGALLPQRQRLSRTVQGSMGMAAATAVVAATAAATADALKSVEATTKLDELKKVLKDGRKSQERHKERDLGRRKDEADKRRDEVKRADDKPAQPPVREWDRNKMRASEEKETTRTVNRRRYPSGGRHQDRDEMEIKKQRRSDVGNEMPVKNNQKVEEPPAKLLDDLFRKTKATPCIYWLPLTEEQIAEKEKQVKKLEAERLQRRAERDKKLEEERDERMKARAVAQREREGDRRRDF